MLTILCVQLLVCTIFMICVCHHFTKPQSKGTKVKFAQAILSCVVQVCHIVLGLKPSSRAEEGEIVLGWLRRAQTKSLTIGQFWYIINMDWWNIWLDYVSHQVTFCTHTQTHTHLHSHIHLLLKVQADHVSDIILLLFHLPTNGEILSCISSDSSYLIVSFESVIIMTYFFRLRIDFCKS